MTRVIYIDKSVGFVPGSDIEGMITAGKIALFCGPDGWISLSHDHPCALNDQSKQEEAWTGKNPVRLNPVKPSRRSVTNCVLNKQRASMCGRIACEWLCACA